MNRLLVVSNRLPVTIEGAGNSQQVRTSSGGLVSALKPIIQRFGGCWIGSAEDPNAETWLDAFAESEGFHLSPLFLRPGLRHDYYNGFCNEILWPLFHDLQSRCNFEARYWHAYAEANAQFAQAVVSRASKHDIIWVHDYHLMLQGNLLNQNFDRKHLAYFHHVPFPPADVFEKLPWRKNILEGLLGFGLIGFQSSRDRHNFVASVRRILPEAALTRKQGTLAIVKDSAKTIIGTFPIGIDFEDFSRTALAPKVVEEVRSIRKRLKGCRLVLGVDRLDYTKGIGERIKGFAALLERYPGLHGSVVLMQFAIPSRQSICEYKRLREDLEQLISSVNSRFGREGWVPIQYRNRHLSRAELVAFYCAADVALITPVKDGMNLVCKEFCASRVDESGILILSEFAGAAHQLKTGAVLVNPYDAEGIANALYHAFEMDQRDISRRMRRMRNVVRGYDVFAWCSDLLGSLGTPTAIPGEKLTSSAESETEPSQGSDAAIEANGL